MKKLTWPLIFFFSIILWPSLAIRIIAQTKKPPMGNANAPSKKDTTLQKQYVYRITIEANALVRISYVLDSLMGQWGVEKGGTEIKNANAVYLNHKNYLLKSAQLDSIVTTKK